MLKKEDDNVSYVTPTQTPVIDLGQKSEISGASFGFGNEFITMKATKGSEYTSGIATAIFESYKNERGSKPKLSIMDKEVIGNLAYSTIVLSLMAGEVVNYFVVILEATGRAPMTAGQIIAEVNSVVKIPGQRPTIYTPDDAVDGILHDEIKRVLAEEYKAKRFQSVDGVVIPATSLDVSVIGQRIAAMAYNALNIEAKLALQENSDLNLIEARAKVPNSILRITHDMSRGTLTDEVSRPVRADFKVELVLSDTNTAVQSLNIQDSKRTLARISGFVDALPEEVTIPGPNQTMTIATRLRPHIIITNVAVNTPTVGYMLLGIVGSLVMMNKDMWLAAVMPSDKNNTGALNIATNLEMNPNKIGNILDISGKKVTQEELYNVLTQMFSLDPVVSFDVQSFGPQSYYTSVLSTAAQPGNSRAKMNAAAEIIHTAVQLTGGLFPADFNPNEIFANSGVVVPLGIWHDKNGERDIRDIDLSFIAGQTGDVNVVAAWALSNLPKEASGSDQYLTKIDIISKYIKDAEINGKAMRVMFSAKFLNTLFQAAVAAGVDPRYEPAVMLNETSSISVIGGYLNNAVGINAGQFARTQQRTGPGFTTMYSNMGANRY